ncbi:hypothetical protein CFD26_107270 [Aspergillus turcosus]|uniref:Uncharacterized protein n=1 Tax=Aspergillus turcosus TaxID=1245748 RepID=A0A3R7J7Q6_9EURO|nr:hypothetical protein CFD26_107270 [Aspergillus turcosus]
MNRQPSKVMDMSLGIDIDPAVDDVIHINTAEDRLQGTSNQYPEQPQVSKEAKQHAQDVRDNELGGEQVHDDFYQRRGDDQEDPTESRLDWAATHNPGVTDEGKRGAAEKYKQQLVRFYFDDNAIYFVSGDDTEM